jgi:hypothetical protein
MVTPDFRGGGENNATQCVEGVDNWNILWCSRKVHRNAELQSVGHRMGLGKPRW